MFIRDYLGFPGGTVVKNPPANARDMALIPELERSPVVGNDNLRQYSWLENSMDRGVWGAIVHGISTHQTWLSDYEQPHTISLYSRSMLLLHNKSFFNSSFIFGITTLNSEAQVFPSPLIPLWWIPVSSRVLLHELKGWLLLEVGRDPSSWYWRA